MLSNNCNKRENRTDCLEKFCTRTVGYVEELKVLSGIIQEGCGQPMKLLSSFVKRMILSTSSLFVGD